MNYKNLFVCLSLIQTAHPFTYVPAIETLQAIEEIILNKKKGAWLRFGDGDLALAYGKRSGTHKYRPHLEIEMKEAFAMNDPYILKSLPLICPEHGGTESELFYPEYQHSEELCTEFRAKAQKIWGAPIDIIYSPVAVPYTAVMLPSICIDFLRFLREHNCELFIGNRNIPAEIIRLLFGNCARVWTPSTTAYSRINKIERTCLRRIEKVSDRYRILIVSCGNAGRVLIKRLWPQMENVFFFDIGSLMDAICGWQTRGWMKNPQFDRDRFVNALFAELKAIN